MRPKVNDRIKINRDINWIAGKVPAGETGTIKPHGKNIQHKIIWDNPHKIRDKNDSFVFGVWAEVDYDWMERIK
jgi:hypothetical protein